MCHTTNRHHKLLNLARSLRSPLWVTHRYEVNVGVCFLSWGTALELCESNREGGEAVLYGSSQYTAGGGLHTALGRQGSVGLLGDQPGAYIRSNLLNSPFSHADFSPSLSRLSISLYRSLRKERCSIGYTQICNSVIATSCTNSENDTMLLEYWLFISAYKAHSAWPYSTSSILPNTQLPYQLLICSKLGVNAWIGP